MRELKFRTYHKNKKQMFKVCSFCEEFVKIVTDVDLVEKYNIDDFEHLMQYTGLKDKNDVEIYEGDILGRYGKEHPCGEYISNVIWNYIKGEWYLKKTWISGQRNLWRWCDKMEIIGNIHDNPELLHQPKAINLKK